MGEGAFCDLCRIFLENWIEVDSGWMFFGVESYVSFH